jgi:hypothetical protein
MFAVSATIMLINGFYMLISPKAWFALPKWLALQGVLTPERYATWHSPIGVFTHWFVDVRVKGAHRGPC